MNLSSDAFDSCRNLTSITYGGTEAQWAAFSVDVPASCKVSCSDNNFTALQDLITAKYGGTLTLDKDYIAAGGEAQILISSGKTITIDLNGHTIDRNLTETKENGSVIYNEGTLTIKDNSAAKTGRITGAWTTGDGGGIYSNGTLTLISGTVSGNKSDSNGGGVDNNGTFTMNSGTISGNTADSGGGVHNSSHRTFEMNGGTISGNKTENGNNCGGGVCNSGTFTIKGGTITGNTAPAQAAVYLFP